MYALNAACEEAMNMRADVTMLDGAVGTSLWEKASEKVAVWRYNVDQPEIVRELAAEYVDAGAQIVLANTFAANAGSMKGTDYDVRDVVSRAVDLAREGIAWRAKLSLSIGPLTELLEPYGELSAEDAYAMYDEQISAGVERGVDLIYMQTFMDLEMMKIALRAASRHDVPVMCSFSFDQKGRTMMGNSVGQICQELSGFPLEAIGLNCSLGPDLALPVMAQFGQHTDLPLIFKPNAGKPISGGAGGNEFDVETFVNDSLPALDYNVKYIGGCCGSNPRYIRRLAERVRELKRG